MPTVQEILKREGFSDAAILRHGFTDYMRDYEIIVDARNGLPNTDLHKYQFIGCVEVHYQTRVSPLIFTESLPDEFGDSGPDYPEKEDPDGFIWDVRYLTAHWVYLEESDRSKYWSKVMKREMHQITIETEAFQLTTYLQRYDIHI